MPKTTLTQRQRRANALAGLITGSMREYGISQTELADKLGTSRMSLYRRMNDGEFTVSEIATLAKTLNWSDQDILKVFRKE